ncbi:unnamed protein product [Ectocarpus sp. 8 AP-2014]
MFAGSTFFNRFQRRLECHDWAEGGGSSYGVTDEDDGERLPATALLACVFRPTGPPFGVGLDVKIS